MSRTFNNWSSLKKAIQNEVRSALIEATEKTYEDAKINAEGFYTGGTPNIYQRTGQFGDSPKMKYESLSGDSMSSIVYLNDEYDYDTGTYSAHEVFEQAEIGGSGIVGLAGTWERTLEDAEENIKVAFGKQFK